MLLAIDPGLATCGVALFDDDHRLVDADVFTSKPAEKPKTARGAWFAADLGRRAHELATWLRDLVDSLDGDGDRAIVESFGVGGRAGSAVVQLAVAAGTVRAILSEALPPARIAYCTPAEWREGLGFEPSRAPRGTLSREKARLKREDDARLYRLVRSLPDGDRVEAHVVDRGRRPSDAVHALDGFGIGRWFLGLSATRFYSAAFDATRPHAPR